MQYIYGTPAFPSKAIAEAIENLIQENKELKEKAKNTMELIGSNYIHKDKVKEKIEEIEGIIGILEAKPYTAYTLYGDILHESDEIAHMLKRVLEKE